MKNANLKQELEMNGGIVPAQVLKDGKKAKKLEEAAAAALPPPGDYRRHVLSLRKQELDAEANRLADLITAGVKTEDIAEKIGLDNDVARHFDGVGGITFKNARPDKVYLFLPDRTPRDNPGALIEQQKLVPGWEVVRGWECKKECGNASFATCGHNFPEARELIDENGYRRVGDTVMLRCDLTQHLLNVATARAMRRQRRKGVVERLVDPSGRRIRTVKKDQVIRDFFARVGGSNAGKREHLTEGLPPSMGESEE